jgi:hypothetical protein
MRNHAAVSIGQEILAAGPLRVDTVEKGLALFGEQ